MKRWMWIIPIVLLVGGGIWWANGRSQASTNAQEATTNEIVEVIRGDLSANATASGEIISRREASLSVTTPGRVESVAVSVGENVEAGDLLMQLDTADLELNLATAQQNLRLQEASLENLLADPDEADIVAAEANVASAQAALDDLLAEPSEAELAVYEANLQISQSSLWSASAELSGVQDSVSQSQIQQAEAALLSAQIRQEQAAEANAENTNQQTHEALLEANQALAQAQANLDALLAGPNQAQLGSAQGSVAAADARLDGTQADYNLFLEGASAANIASAEAQLAQAQASLASLLEPASDQDIQSASAAVEQAQLNVTAAEEALADATITAPFAGMVTAVDVQVGEYATGVVIELLDNSQLEVILQVDEIDVGQLAEGQTAVITLEAWPDTEITSEITSIAVSGNVGNVVTYDVYLSLNNTDLPVRVGMTANADLITANYDNVLLLINRAINVDRENGIYTVNRMNGDAVETVEITIGVRDGQYTQILDGLSEGDEIMIGENRAPVDLPFGPPRD